MSDSPRSLPSASASEANVLGTVLAEDASWWRAVERVSGEENVLDLFYDPNLRLVASAVSAILAEDGPLTDSALFDRLRTDPASENLVPDVRTFLIQLQSQASIRSIEDLQKTAHTLNQKRQLRSQILAMDQIRTGAANEEYTPNEVASLLRTASAEAAAVREVKRFGDVIRALREEGDLGVPWRIPTGIKVLDRAIRGGYEPGRLYVFGARPKVGKTTVLLNNLLEALASNAVVLFASLEINERELYSKLLSAQAWVPQREIQDLLDGKRRRSDFDPQQASDLAQADRELEHASLFTMFATDIGPGGVDTVIAAGNYLRTVFPDRPLIIFIDYIQLLVKGGDGRNYNRSQEIGDISRRLKLFAIDANAAVVTPSQINRSGAEDGMPSPHQLRESGNLEQDADCVIMLNRPHLQDESEPAHIMDMWIALNRIGASATVQANYLPEYQTVSDLAAEDEGFDDTVLDDPTEQEAPRSSSRAPDTSRVRVSAGRSSSAPAAPVDDEDDDY